MDVRRLMDELRTDPALRHLTPEQAEAVLLALQVIGWADSSFGTREETELEQMLQELPWWEGKAAAVREASRQIAARIAEAAGDETSLRGLLAEAAAALPDPPVRQKVYGMAARLGWVDQHLHPDERRVMRWLAEAFEIDADTAERLLFSASR